MSAAGTSAAAVALLNQGGGGLGAELRTALQALGATIAYESQLAALDRAALGASGARVVVINLAPGEDVPDDVVDWLDAESYEIVINDSETSAKLEGFDLARFARHLAAKILHRPDIILPPRPPGAVAPPTAQQHWAERVPEADIPGAPPPSRLATPPVSPAPTVQAAAPAPAPAASPERAVEPAGGDQDSIDAQLAQALQSLEASARNLLTPAEEVPDLDALLASAPLVEEAPPPAAPRPAAPVPPPPRPTAPEPATAAPAEMDWSNWSLEPVDEGESGASAPVPAPPKQKSSEFGFETVSLTDSLAPHVEPDEKPDEHMQAASTVRKLDTIPAHEFLSPEVDPGATATGATAIKPPVLSTLELVPLDDEESEESKSDPKKK
jgi:two-component system chemotaxis response regulator CheB/chemosensory pili system protein ChpB (putative protein-glutamate methylesterase)